MQLKTITELLTLPNFQVVSMLEHNDTSIHFYVDLVEPVAPVCSACGMVHHSPVHSIGWVRAEDLPLCGKRVFLYAVEDRTPRVYPWMNEPGGGIMIAWNFAVVLIVLIVSSTM